MILITGNMGYIGRIMTKLFQDNSCEVVGLDCGFYKDCQFYDDNTKPFKQIEKDIRDIDRSDLEGIEAIIHLAALSNDPLGKLNPDWTNQINCAGSLKLAQLAKESGIERFIFSSSCSIYGIADNDRPLNEENPINPLTEYAKTKVAVEKDVSGLASDNFHPVFMRNATAYGLSPSLRLDLVVNDLVARGYLTKKITILTDGTPWRPIIHVFDLCQAFLAALKAPVEKIHDQTFNVGINEENYQVKDIAMHVKKIVPETSIEILSARGNDERSYRVDFSKIKESLPDFSPVWNVKKGIDELYKAYAQNGLAGEDLEDTNYFRLKKIKHLIESGRLDKDLRWI
ncbi:NAD-dependent epimerase/dehydratase family protein [Candidatus Omnitrophota bacterium]